MVSDVTQKSSMCKNIPRGILHFAFQGKSKAFDIEELFGRTFKKTSFHDVFCG